MYMFIILIFIILILFFVNWYFKKSLFEHLNSETIYIDNQIYQLDPKQKIYTNSNDCDSYCDEKDCLKFKRRLSLINKCIECKKKGLCLKETITDPLCSTCDETNSEKSCYDYNFSCPNPNNLQSQYKVKPYFLINKASSVNSATDSVCNFCWNI